MQCNAQCIALNFAMQCKICNSNAMQCTMQLHCIEFCIVLHFIALQCSVVHCIALCCIAVQCNALHCIVLCIALHCIALHCIALHCIELHYALHWSAGRL